MEKEEKGEQGCVKQTLEISFYFSISRLRIRDVALLLPGGRLLIHLAPLGNGTTLCGGDSLCPESLLPRQAFIYGEEQQSKNKTHKQFFMLMLPFPSISENCDPTQLYDLHFAVHSYCHAEDLIFIRKSDCEFLAK